MVGVAFWFHRRDAEGAKVFSSSDVMRREIGSIVPIIQEGAPIDKLKYIFSACSAPLR